MSVGGNAVAISFDTSYDASALMGEQHGGRGSKQHTGEDSCGESLDWLRGIEGLAKSVERSPGVSRTLAKVIETDIIPRLLLAHSDHSGRYQPRSSRVSAQPTCDVDAFSRLVLKSEPVEIMEEVQALISSGVSLKRIYLDFLAPVARRLGELWEEDRCTFTDVTLGVSRLHYVLREVGRRNGDNLNNPPTKRRVYLVPSPGERHTFGLSMVGEFFLHAGWEVATDHAAAAATILESVSSQWLDVIGFTVGCVEHLDPLLVLIDRTRKESSNREITIMVGGRLFLDKPDFALRISGATVISDGVNAVNTAETLLAQKSRSDSVQQLT
jgi:methanogenic corrinoid protein MtbC1